MPDVEKTAEFIVGQAIATLGRVFPGCIQRDEGRARIDMVFQEGSPVATALDELIARGPERGEVR